MFIIGNNGFEDQSKKQFWSSLKKNCLVVAYNNCTTAFLFIFLTFLYLYQIKSRSRFLQKVGYEKARSRTLASWHHTASYMIRSSWVVLQSSSSSICWEKPRACKLGRFRTRATDEAGRSHSQWCYILWPAEGIDPSLLPLNPGWNRFPVSIVWHSTGRTIRVFLLLVGTTAFLLSYPMTQHAF